LYDSLYDFQNTTAHQRRGKHRARGDYTASMYGLR
jgi:hypothetical protein